MAGFVCLRPNSCLLSMKLTSNVSGKSKFRLIFIFYTDLAKNKIYSFCRKIKIFFKLNVLLLIDFQVQFAYKQSFQRIKFSPNE